MLLRRVASHLKAALDRQAAVALIGPRQVGKTTLALTLAEQTPSLYLDLEAAPDRAKLADPVLFLRTQEDRLVILDEIHRVPELFQALRGLIDEGRRRGRRTGRFLVLGSASIDLLRQSGESLAGRIEFVPLGALDALEVDGDLAAADRLWLRGGFPDSFLAVSDADSLRWRQSFIRTYLERDVPQFGSRIPAETLERLWTMLAHGQGALLNASRLAAGLAVSAPTITSYIDLLVDLLLVRRLRPWHGNLGKRLVKSPKVYVRDSGLAHALLGIATAVELAGHPVVGPSFESYVVENLLAAAPERTAASFYRTVAGAEMDLVLDLPGGQRWAVEIKRGLAPGLGRGFHQARADLEPQRSFVVHSGTTHWPLADGVEAIGVYRTASAEDRHQTAGSAGKGRGVPCHSPRHSVSCERGHGPPRAHPARPPPRPAASARWQPARGLALDPPATAAAGCPQPSSALLRAGRVMPLPTRRPCAALRPSRVPADRPAALPRAVRPRAARPSQHRGELP